MNPDERIINKIIDRLTAMLDGPLPNNATSWLIEFYPHQPGFAHWTAAVDLMLKRGQVIGARVENYLLILRQCSTWN